MSADEICQKILLFSGASLHLYKLYKYFFLIFLSRVAHSETSRPEAIDGQWYPCPAMPINIAMIALN